MKKFVIVLLLCLGYIHTIAQVDSNCFRNTINKANSIRQKAQQNNDLNLYERAIKEYEKSTLCGRLTEAQQAQVQTAIKNTNNERARLAEELVEKERVAKRKLTKQNEATLLTTIALQYIKSDPTIAIRAVEKALEKNPDNKSFQIIFNDIYKTSSFYEYNYAPLDGSLITTELSDDGRYLFVATNNHIVKMIDRESYEVAKEFSGHENYVIAIDQHRNYLITGSWDATVRLWDISSEENQLVHVFNHFESEISNLGFFASRNDDPTPLIWVATDDGEIHFLTTDEFSTGNNMEVYDNEAINTVDFIEYQENFYMLTAGNNGAAILWVLDQDSDGLFKEVKRIGGASEEHESYEDPHYHHARFILQEKYLRIVVGGCDNTLRIIDVKSGQVLDVLKGHERDISLIEVIDNEFIVSAANDNRIKIWDLNGNKELLDFVGHKELIRSIDAMDDYIISSSFDGSIKTWHLPTNLKGQKIDYRLAADNSHGLYPQKGSRFIFNGHSMKDPDHLRMEHMHDWDKDSLNIHIGGNQAVIFAEEPLLFRMEQDKLVSYNYRGKRLRKYHGYDTPLSTFDIDYAGTQVLAGSEAGDIILWEQKGDLKYIQKHSQYNITATSLSKKGRMGVSGDAEGNLVTFTTLPYTQKTKVAGAHAQEVTEIEWAVNGSAYATGSNDQLVKLWDANGALLNTLRFHTASISAIGFSADSKLLLVGDKTGSASLWSNEGEFIMSFHLPEDDPITAVQFLNEDQHIALINQENIAFFYRSVRHFKEVKEKYIAKLSEFELLKAYAQIIDTQDFYRKMRRYYMSGSRTLEERVEAGNFLKQLYDLENNAADKALLKKGIIEAFGRAKPHYKALLELWSMGKAGNFNTHFSSVKQQEKLRACGKHFFNKAKESEENPEDSRKDYQHAKFFFDQLLQNKGQVTEEEKLYAFTVYAKLNLSLQRFEVEEDPLVLAKYGMMLINVTKDIENEQQRKDYMASAEKLHKRSWEIKPNTRALQGILDTESFFQRPIRLYKYLADISNDDDLIGYARYFKSESENASSDDLIRYYDYTIDLYRYILLSNPELMEDEEIQTIMNDLFQDFLAKKMELGEFESSINTIKSLQHLEGLNTEFLNFLQGICYLYEGQYAKGKELVEGIDGNELVGLLDKLAEYGHLSKDTEKVRATTITGFNISDGNYLSAGATTQLYNYLRQRASQIDDYQVKLFLFEQATELLANMDLSTEEYNSKKAECLSTMAFYSAMLNDVENTLSNANEAIKLQENEDWMYTNRALAYILMEDLEKAKMIYTKLEDKTHQGESFVDICLEDLYKLLDQGIESTTITDAINYLSKKG